MLPRLSQKDVEELTAYDIRGFAPDLVAGCDEEALPPSRSQERCWTRAIRPRLAAWVRDTARPLVEKALDQAGFAARGSSGGCGNSTLRAIRCSHPSDPCDRRSVSTSTRARPVIPISFGPS